MGGTARARRCPTVTPEPSVPGYRLENEYAVASSSAVTAPALEPSDSIVLSHPAVGVGPPARAHGDTAGRRAA